jgi:glycosyltransferase involved in cell wall biosynthesis
MQYVEGAILLIIGSGDAIPNLELRIKNLKLENKVIMLGKMKPEELYHYTCNADIGLSLDKNTNLNYQLSLPNKLFDYTFAGVPVLASPLVEIKSFIDKYKVGICIESHNAKHIADKLNYMLTSHEYNIWKANTQIAAQQNNWENEKKVWVDMINKIKSSTSSD